MTAKYRIGFFAESGRDKFTATHVLTWEGKLLCGSRVSPKKEFQWCANFRFDQRIPGYIECSHCRRLARKILEEAK